MPILITVLIVLLVLLLFLAAFVLMRTTVFSRPVQPVDPIEGMKVDPEVIAEHLAAAVRKVTISNANPERVDGKPFLELHQVLEGTYPRVHATLDRRVINRYGLLYTWKGRKPELDPVLFAAHMDVVPVEQAGLEEWEHPPFAGQIAGGYVWGRGTLDMKGQLIALLEAVENLIKDGYRPERTMYLAFGCDEEVTGLQGAGAIAALLADEGVHLEAVLDEGGAILETLMAGVKSPVAMIGVAEKGYLSLELVAPGEPGHSSTPPSSTAIGILSAGLARLEGHAMPARLNWMMMTLREAAPALPFSLQMLLANTWLFGRAVLKRLEAVPKTNAAVRTTQAVTMISGGLVDNLLPQEARAVVNFRLLPGDTIAGVCEYVRKALADERITFHPLEGTGVREASPVSPTNSTTYQDLVRTVNQIFPDVVVAPYLMLGAADARYYTPLCENVYRFTPLLMRGDDLGRVHGNNERIQIEDLGAMVQFFGQIMKTWGGG